MPPLHQPLKMEPFRSHSHYFMPITAFAFSLLHSKYNITCLLQIEVALANMSYIKQQEGRWMVKNALDSFWPIFVPCIINLSVIDSVPEIRFAVHE